ncbi:MAG TPA: response regulator transcription factor [Bacteroidales bacterium]|nr:response regulator transcription factor [Bacteroidales bacterium]
MKLLIIEDETVLMEGMTEFLTAQGFLCEKAATFDQASEKLFMYDYDVILLDLMLPGGSGLDLLRQLKKENQDAGVLIISAKDSLDDKIDGLNLGADDYITKPFHLEELNARIQALIRRKNQQGNQQLVFNEIVIDPSGREVFVHEQPVVLTKKEYDLLLYLLVNKKRVISKQGIAEHLWGDDYDMADNYDFVYVHMNNLRKKLTAAGCADYIKTVYGMGYKFTE